MGQRHARRFQFYQTRPRHGVRTVGYHPPEPMGIMRRHSFPQWPRNGAETVPKASFLVKPHPTQVFWPDRQCSLMWLMIWRSGMTLLLRTRKLSKGCLCAFKRTTTRTVEESVANPITLVGRLGNLPPMEGPEVSRCGCPGEAIQSPKRVTQTVR